MEATTNNKTLNIVNAYDLYIKDMPPTKWYIGNILHEGACLFTGDPKVGKSFLALQIAIAVAGSGETVCGGLDVGQHGRVLYLAFDDTSEKRIHKRLHDLTDDVEAVKNIDIVCQRDVGTLKDGLYELLDETMRQHEYVFVILDTLGAVSAGTGNKNVYDAEYKEAVGLAALAQKHGICLLIIHHTNKGDGADLVARAGGSHGRTGGVDSLMELTKDGHLHTAPRDGEKSRLYMERSENGGWKVTDWQMGLPMPTPDPELNSGRKAVSDLLSSGPKLPTEVATTLQIKPDTARKRLERMKADQQAVRLEDGRYGLPDEAPVEGTSVRPVQVSETDEQSAAA